MTAITPLPRTGGPHVIVLGNEKGGSGKSTTAMHLVVALLKAGHQVGAIDLDARQGTLSRQVENRRTFAQRNDLALDDVEKKIVQAAKRESEIHVARESVSRETAVRRGTRRP